jgi:hypothetical protein
MLDAARAEFPMLKMADLVICSYPYVLCPFLGTYEGRVGCLDLQQRSHAYERL